ncbi:DUF1636 family protein [Gymnodinialimonas ulvae]|uniref:DUF1636 family protein n=1 Tax=Gymnodinialimonas ulvae TaxID=3126504 RepID=UPI0030B627C5
MSAVLRLCTSCDGADIAALQAAVDAAGLRAQVEPQSCMNACANPVSLALQGTGRATYFFAGVDPVTDRADIIATLRTYLEAPGGWIEDATACGRLRFCLQGRVPALD